MLETELLQAVRQWNASHGHLPYLIATNSRVRLLPHDPTSRIPNGFVVSSDKPEAMPEEIFELLSPKDVVQRADEAKAKYKSEGEIEEEKERQQRGEACEASEPATGESMGELHAIKRSLLATYRDMLREPKYAGLRRIYIINPFRREWAVLTPRHAQPLPRTQAECDVREERLIRQRSKREIDGVNGGPNGASGGLAEADRLERDLEACRGHVSSTTRTLNPEDGSDYYPPLQWHASERLVMAAPPYAEIDLTRIYDAEQHVTREDLQGAPSKAAGDLLRSEEGVQAPVRQTAVNMAHMRHVVEREYARGFWRGLFSGGLSLSLLVVISLATRIYTPEGSLVHWLQSEYVGGSFSLTILVAGMLCFAISPIFLSSRLLVDGGDSHLARELSGGEVSPQDQADRDATEEGERQRGGSESMESIDGSEQVEGLPRASSGSVGFLKQLMAREAKRGFWRGILTSCGCLSLVLVISWCYGLFTIMHNMA